MLFRSGRNLLGRALSEFIQLLRGCAPTQHVTKELNRLILGMEKMRLTGIVGLDEKLVEFLNDVGSVAEQPLLP